MKKVLLLNQSIDYYIWKAPELVKKVMHLVKKRTHNQVYNRLQYIVKHSTNYTIKDTIPCLRNRYRPKS